MVASFTDAWIETDKYFIKLSLSLSHLLQMRGLKQYGDVKKLTPLQVASFTDAWIETKKSDGKGYLH